MSGGILHLTQVMLVTWCRRKQAPIKPTRPVGSPALLLALALAMPLEAQQLTCCSFRDWSLSGSMPWRNHPEAHLIGGMALDGLVRLPLFNDAIRQHAAGRLAAVAVIQSGWEFWQLKETEGYPLRYAALDVGAAVLGAALLELFLSPHKRQ